MAGSIGFSIHGGGEGQLVIGWFKVQGFQGLGFKALRIQRFRS